MKTNRKPFTEEEQAFLLENRLKMPSRKLAEHLGCSKSKVQSYFKSKNLAIPPEVRERFRIQGMKGRTSFTPEMDEVLKENYLKIPVKRLGAMIGKSYTGIMIRLRHLGLEIPKELRVARKKKGQMKPGTIPQNKGKKQSEFLSPEAIERSKKYRFKKGQTPHNIKYNGYERMSKSGYVEVRVKQGKFVQKHRLVWERENGPVPKGYVVVFKDGNPSNCKIENLEMITRGELAVRNKMGFESLPMEMKTSIKLINKINKELK